MSTILALETATSSCSAALSANGGVYSRSEVGNNIHSQVLLAMVESLLSEADITPQQLDAIAVGQGPGSFTGLRIGVGVGQGLAYGAGCPMIGVSSLDALALQAETDGIIVSAIDARMGEIYWCGYEKDGVTLERVGDLRVTSPELIELPSGSSDCAALVGNAWSEYKGQFNQTIEAQLGNEAAVVYPQADALLRLAEQKWTLKDFVSAAEFAPIYVRNDVAKKSSKPLFVRKS